MAATRLALLALGLAAGCTGLDLEGHVWSCRSDRDCLKGYLCVSGACRLADEVDAWRADLADTGRPSRGDTEEPAPDGGSAGDAPEATAPEADLAPGGDAARPGLRVDP